MQCSNCGNKMDRGWKHCPKCGMRTGVRGSDDIFSQLFREMDEMARGAGFNADKNMEVIDISGMLNDMMKSMAGSTSATSVRSWRSNSNS